MSQITSKLRAAIGALGILACASPLAAQTHPSRGQMRVAAQWVDRGQGVRRPVRWRRAAEWRMERREWRRGYARWYGWRGAGLRRPFLRRSVAVRLDRRFYLQRRPWAGAGWRHRAI